MDLNYRINNKDVFPLMIVTDLDRTLLRDNKTISAYTVDVLTRCRSMGIKIVFATARPRRVVGQFVEAFSPDALILHNGAVTIIGGTVIQHSGIAPSLAQKILLSIERRFPETTLSIEINDTLYANFDVSTVWDNVSAEMSDFSNLPDKPAEKIIVNVSSMEDIDRLANLLPDDLYIEMSEGRHGLIMHKNATKQKAVSHLVDVWGIGLRNVTAFGDDYNDIGMLRYCGTGVAMRNGIEAVKAVSDYVCGNNNEDGVAKWLEERILNKNQTLV